MKKTLLAAALAVGFAGVAQAETSVTLYGIIDAGIQYERQNGVIDGVDANGDFTYSKRTRTGMTEGIDKGNRWGLRGVEDLGDGLRAVFVLESGFSTLRGQSIQGGRLFGRQATIGLHSDSWGSVDVGRQISASTRYFLGAVDPFGPGYGQNTSANVFTATDWGANRHDNSILYQTPNFSGFQLGVSYSFNTNGAQAPKLSGTKDTNQRAVSAAARYANGPLAVVLTYDQIKRSANVGYADTTRRQWNIGGAYDFEVVKVHAGFGQTRNGDWKARDIWTTAGNIGFIDGYDRGFKANSYMLGLSAPVGAGRVMASWYMMDPRSKSDAIRDFDDLTGSNTKLKKMHAYNIGYVYPLSKRTSVYASASYAKNVNFVEKQKSTVVNAGLRHSF